MKRIIFNQFTFYVLLAVALYLIIGNLRAITEVGTSWFLHNFDKIEPPIPNS